MVKKKLELVGLKEDLLDLKPAQLSGGMRKRVGLARAIAVDPEIILYDEPTSGLDPVSSEAINDLIVEMQKKLGVTSVVVTHDMHSAYKVANRIAMIYDGKIIGIRHAGGNPCKARISISTNLSPAAWKGPCRFVEEAFFNSGIRKTYAGPQPQL